MYIYLIKLAILLAFLGFLSYEDIKTKTVPNKILLIILAIGGLFSVIELNLSNLISSLIIGISSLVVTVFLSFITKGNFGMGDAKLLSIIGFYIGNFYVLYVAFYSLLLIFAFSIIMLILRRASMKTQLPFIPFITGGLLIYLIALI